MIWALWLLGCTPDELDPAVDTTPIPGTTISMDFQRSDFYDAPWPSQDLVVGGVVDFSGFPNPDGVAFIEDVRGLLHQRAEAFGTTSGVFFSLDGPLGDLPALEETVTADSPVFLMRIEGDEIWAGAHPGLHPVDVDFRPWGGPLGSGNQLSLLPLQGIPLAKNGLYAAVVLRSLGDADGEPLGVSGTMRQILAGEQPLDLDDDAFADYQEAVSQVGRVVESEEIAAITVFRTWDPMAGLSSLIEQAEEIPLSLDGTPELVESFDEFCVYRTEMDLPVYQQGTPPFQSGGGGWGETPMQQGFERARVFFTIPREAPPADGFPLVMMVRTGGGGDRPLIDRGVRDETGEVVVPGSGPALELARVGIAGVQVDGPHGGLRNITGQDEQFLMFNFTNPAALRDNVRQSALELALMPPVLERASVDATDCPGVDQEVSFDPDHLGLIGHSMGATIAPLVLATTSEFGAAVLSGAGGSYITNVVYKESPLVVRPLAEATLNYPDRGAVLHEHDPALSMLQWAGEVADPPAYFDGLTTRNLDVLVVQGIVDTYILPPIANPANLALENDLAGPALDESEPRLEAYRSLGEELPFRDGEQLGFPVQNNLPGRTRAVVQHAEDGIEDGHEVMFQVEAAKVQVRCFLDSWLSEPESIVVDPDVGCD